MVTYEFAVPGNSLRRIGGGFGGHLAHRLTSAFCPYLRLLRWNFGVGKNSQKLVARKSGP